MALKSGMAGQIGVVAESTPGTPVTVTSFQPLVSESLAQQIDMIESSAMFTGQRVIRSSQWALGAITAGGSVQLELTNKSLRTWFKNMFGGESGSGPYTYTPGDLSGVSFTTQVGRPDLAGTVHPFTYAGCKINSWEIACKEGEIATLGADIVAMHEIGYRVVTDGVTTSSSTDISSTLAAFGPDDIAKPISGTGIPAGATIASVTSATAANLSAAANATGTGVTFTIGIPLASASYTSGILPLHYANASVTLGGSSFKVKEATISGNNTLSERRFLGQRYTSEPLEAGWREYTGSLTAEFNDRTAYNRFVNGTEAALVLTFADSTGTAQVAITTNVRFDGETPQVGGPDILSQNLPFKCVGSSTDASAITAVVTTA